MSRREPVRTDDLGDTHLISPRYVFPQEETREMDLRAVDPDGARGRCRRTDGRDFEFDAGRPR